VSPSVEHDREGRRFVATVDGAEAYVMYRESDGVVDFVSTYTPPPLRGRGIARAVVDAGLAWARAQGKEVRGSCWYVEKVLTEEAAG
jgi:predicted GNAT family acetyltransferase